MAVVMLSNGAVMPYLGTLIAVLGLVGLVLAVAWSRPAGRLIGGSLIAGSVSSAWIFYFYICNWFC